MAMLEKCPQCQQPLPHGQSSCPLEHTEIEMVEIDEEAFSSVGAPSAEPPGDPLIGQLIDNRYRIERLLGAGGMGKVYSAIHLVTGQRFAIKMLHPQLINHDEARRRFERESKVISTIDHPHIVELYDYGQLPSGAPFLVMEFMEGATMRTFLGTPAAAELPVGQGVLLSLQMAQALQHVHERGVVHREVLKIDSDCPRFSGI